MNRPKRRHDRWLMLIAIFKFCKAILLILAGLGALELIHPGVFRQVQEHVWSLGPGLRYKLEHLLERGDGHPARLRAVGLIAFGYAVLFLVEGTGLWLEKRWGEIVTIVITSSLIPVEIYELVHRFTVVRLGALIINVGVVIYLVLRLRANAKAGSSRSRKA